MCADIGPNVKEEFSEVILSLDTKGEAWHGYCIYSTNLSVNSGNIKQAFTLKWYRKDTSFSLTDWIISILADEINLLLQPYSDI